MGVLQDVPQAERAWEFFRIMGSPKYHVAPMVDQSELPFRMLCRKHGSTSAYTPMLHSRLFLETPAYRKEHFTTCPEDRPLFAQFCANDPETLLSAARLIEDSCDAIDLNLGCPQRIAKRGRYGAFLMDDLPLVERIVKTLAQGLKIPVTCKIRIFPEIERTLEYARMLERAGCYILAVHGRTREQKKARDNRANWDYIKAVKQALSIPVLANGNIRNLQDAQDCLAYTGADGVMSAESLLVDPALFSPRRLTPEGAYSLAEAPSMMLEYLDLVERYPCPMRMVIGHTHSILGPWFSEHTDLRDIMNNNLMTLPKLREITTEIAARVESCGRSQPVPKLSARAIARMEAEAARQAAIAEQQREESGLRQLGAKAAALQQIAVQSS